MRSILRSAFLSLSLVMAYAGAAQAQAPAPAGAGGAGGGAGGAGGPAKPAKPAWQVACEGDARKLCAEALKTGKGVTECLAAHGSELSEECTNVFLYKYKIAQLCKDDREKLCKDTTVPLGQCFKEHEKELSEPCRKALVAGTKKFNKDEKPAGATGDKPAEAPAAAPAETTAGKKKPAKKK